MRFITKATFALSIACLTATVNAQAAEHVSVDNFNRAESDFYMKKRVEAGMFGKLVRLKKFSTADDQIVVRMNHDVLFTYGIFDLTKPVTITLPENNGRYQSMRVINQDHYIKLLTYKPGAYVLDQKTIGSRYVHIAIRTLANAGDPADIAEANKLQDQIAFSQQDPGKYDVPEWDPVSQDKVRKALKSLTTTMTSATKMFGDVDQVDPVRHLIGTAAGWGGGPDEDASYIGVVPENNDGKTAYELTVGDVPVDAFWSVTVYNKEGFWQKNPQDLYSYNSTALKKNADGTATIHMGGDPSQPNYLPIFDGWNYTVRLYGPHKEFLDGSWKFPAAKPVK